MDSDDDVLFSSSPIRASPPIQQRKLKRLKKAVRVSQDLPLERPESDGLRTEAKFPEFEALRTGETDERLSPGSGSGAGSEDFGGEDSLDSGFTGLVGDGESSGVKRALDFEGLAGEFDENGELLHSEIGEQSPDVRVEDLEEETRIPDSIEGEKDEMKQRISGALGFEGLTGEFDENGEDRRNEIREESEDVRMDEEWQNPGRVKGAKDEKNKKRKERIADDEDDSKTGKEASNKRRSEKERRDHLKQLHVESQRLLRETRDATFKSVPFVQKPISSVLEKIRQRKLEILKKSVVISHTSVSDDDDEFLREVIVNKNTKVPHVDKGEDNKVSESSNKETVSCPMEDGDNIDETSKDESNDSIKDCSQKVSDMAVDVAPKQEFRAPIDDTQDLFPDSQASDSQHETPSSPLEEVFVPSVLPLNLHFDSAPPDDDSSDEEEFDKENVDPHPRGLADLSLSPSGDPVKAFVDDEAEEEDDSDNDMLRFKENDEDEVEDDVEELNKMIATGYEEKPIDNERRNELHQKWLEQQDAAGTENLLQKLKYGTKVREPTLIDEEDDRKSEDDGKSEDEESDDEAAEELPPSDLVKMNLRKVKQMMPQMFTDNNDGYLSSDDEETEKKLAKQCLLEKAEEQITFFSPAEDESSREIFGRIKKLNIVPDTKKKAKTQTYFDMSLMGANKSISSKPSFLGRASSHSLPSSKKQGSNATRSFIFEREDSNSKSAASVSEDSSEPIQRESRPKMVSAKFISSQTRTLTRSSSIAVKSDTSLLDILKRNFASKRCTFDDMVSQTESILSSFKLAKKTVKPNEERNL